MSSARELIEAILPLEGNVAVVGSANVDVTVMVDEVPHRGQIARGGEVLMSPGGKSLNHAFASALLGAPTSFIGAVGNDTNGTYLLNALEDVGVDTTHVARVGAPTGVAFFTMDPQAEKTLVVAEGANAYVDESVLTPARATIQSAKALGLALEIPMDSVISAAKVARDSGTTTVLTPSPLTLTPPRELLELVDVLILTEDEIEMMVGPLEGDWLAAVNRLNELGVTRAIITLGIHGSLILEQGITRVPPTPVEIVDTTGSDDAYAGGILTAIAAGSTLREAANFACLVSAYATTKWGGSASFGTLEEIAELPSLLGYPEALDPAAS